MTFDQRTKHYYQKFNIHPDTLIHLHDFTLEHLATTRDDENRVRRAKTISKMLTLMKTADDREKKRVPLPWHYRTRVAGVSRNLQHELEDCKAFYEARFQPSSIPASLSPDKWVLRNLAPFFRLPRDLQKRRPQLKKLRQEKDAELMSRHPDEAKIAQLEKEMRTLQRDFKGVAWEELARFTGSVPGSEWLESRRPQKRQKVEARVRSEEPEEEIPYQQLKIEADRIKHLCRDLEPDLPMDDVLAELLESHVMGTIPDGFPNPDALLAALR